MGSERNAKPNYNEMDEVASFLQGREEAERRRERSEALFTDPSIIQSVLQRRERPRVTAFCVAGGKTGSGLPDLRGSRGRNSRGAEGKGPQQSQTSAGYSRPPGSVRNRGWGEGGIHQNPRIGRDLGRGKRGCGCGDAPPLDPAGIWGPDLPWI